MDTAAVDSGKEFPYRSSILTEALGMIKSRLTSKAQTTIPQPVRNALGLEEGDELLYVIDGQCVILSKANPSKRGEDPFGEFSEWRSLEDEKAYGSL